MIAPATSTGAGARLLASVLLLLLLTLLVFPGAFSGGALYYRDLFRVHHPAKTVGLDAVAGSGELPRWSGQHSLGQPFLADPNFTVFYPSNLLYLVLPFNLAFNLHVVLHVFLCGLFTLLLGRRLRLSWPAALVAAGALACGGFLLSLGNFYNAVASASYLPLVLLLFLHACAGEPAPPRRRLAGLAAGAGLALGLQFLGGEPVYLFLTAGLLVLVAATGLALRRLRLVPVAVFLALAALLSALVAAVQLLPAMALIPWTGRGAGFTLAEATRHSVHPFRLLELACPGLFGDPHALSFWGFWGHGWFDGSFPYILTIYVGAGILLLALAAPFGRRRRLAMALWAGVLFFLLLALGRFTPLFPLLWKLVPGAGVLRYPVKFLFPALTLLSLLAGLGAELAWSGERRRAGAAATMGLALGCGLFWLGLAFFGWPASSGLLQARGVPPDTLEAASTGMTASLAHGLALGGISALLLALCLSFTGVRRRLAASALFGLLALDLVCALGGLNPVAPTDFFTTPSPLLQAIESREAERVEPGGEFRLFHDSGKEIPSVRLRAPADDRLWHFHWMRQTLFPMTAPLEYAFEPNWDGLYLDHAAQAARVAITLPSHRRSRFLGLFNVRYLVLFRDPGDPQLTELARFDGGANLEARLMENLACQPRAYWVPGARHRQTEPEVVLALDDPGFDPRREVVLLAEGDDTPGGGAWRCTDASCRLEREGQERVTVVVDCPAPGHLVLADSWSPDWRAEVDGAPALIVRANMAVRAVKVPAGSHTVTFTHQPRWRLAAPALTLLGLGLAGLLVIGALLPLRRTAGAGALLAMLVLLTGCGDDRARRAADPRPNVLLVTIDTLRADYIGCYGSPDVETPNIDRLAAGGVQFMHAVAPSQCTNPSHASILTGLYPAEHGVYDNATPLADEAETLAERLRGQGYETIAAVSAHHLNQGNSNFGQGFETFLGCRPTELDAGERNRRFLKAVRSAADRPFFAWVHYFDPHGHYFPPAPWNRRYPVGDRFAPVEPRPWMDIAEERRAGPVDPDEVVALYKGEISYLDSEIGRLLDLLEENGLHEQTLVVLVADHGESMTEKGIHFCHAGLYNQVLHVPLIFCWPARLPSGARVQTPVSPVDILPTLLDLLGLPAPGQVSGTSLLPAIADPGHRFQRPLFSEAVDGVIRSIHLDGYKFIKAYPEKDWSVTEDHLYRPFGDDYGENFDLITEQPERAARMEQLLNRWLDLAGGRALPSQRREALDRETEEALRQLGYLE